MLLILRQSIRTVYCCAVALLLVAGSQQSLAIQQITLGPADGLLMGHPMVQIGFEDPANMGVQVGPVYSESQLFVLDTAANGILFADRAYWDNERIVDPNMYERAVNGNEDVYYEEMGVAGSESLDVYIPHNVYIRGEGQAEISVGSLTPFGSPDISLGDIAGLAGMPVMINRTVRMNLHGLIEEDNDFKMKTTFNNPPPVTSTTYTIPLTRLPAEHAGDNNAGSPEQLPSFSDIPMIPGTKFTNGDITKRANMIIDTGAQMSIISDTLARQLGIDPDASEQFIQVGGIGGTDTVPVVHFDQLAIPTDQGVDLVFNNLDVVVIDIPGIDAIFGLDAMLGGYLTPHINAFFASYNNGEHDGSYGYFSEMIFDFIGDDWSMRFDVNPAFHNIETIVILGDINEDGVIDGFDVDPFVDALLGGDYNPAADMNDDGVVNGFDVDPFVAAVLAGGGQAPQLSNIPEPATMMLLTLGALVAIKKQS